MLNFPEFTALDLVLCPSTCLGAGPFFTNLAVNHSGLAVSWGLHFLTQAPCHINLLLNKCLYFLLFFCLCQFSFSEPARDRRRVEENLIPPLRNMFCYISDHSYAARLMDGSSHSLIILIIRGLRKKDEICFAHHIDKNV